MCSLTFYDVETLKHFCLSSHFFHFSIILIITFITIVQLLRWSSLQIGDIKAYHPQRVPVLLYATAGLRSLPESDAVSILRASQAAVKEFDYPFLCDADMVLVIDGQKEGLYAWQSAQQMLHLQEKALSRKVGFVDVGGASTQIGFVPDAFERHKYGDEITSVQLHDTRYHVYTHSYLHFGINEAKSRHMNSTIASSIPRYASSALSSSSSSSASWGAGKNQEKIEVRDPCRLEGHDETVFRDGKSFLFIGEGNWDLCLTTLQSMFQPKVGVYGFAGIEQPSVQDENTLFIAMDHFSRVSRFMNVETTIESQIYAEEHIAPLEEWREKGRLFCRRTLEQGVSDIGDMFEGYPTSGYCFEAVYIYTLFTHGYGFESHTKNIVTNGKVGDWPLTWAMGAMQSYFEERLRLERIV